MSNSENKNDLKSMQFNKVLQEYMTQVDEGDDVNQEELLAANPEIANELKEYFDAEDKVNFVAKPESAEDTKNLMRDNLAATLLPQNGIEKTLAPQKPSELISNSGLGENFGRYKIIKQLGAGAMGEVYLAEDTDLHRMVALKIPKFEDPNDTEIIDRFYTEARSAANLRHPHICPVHDVGEMEGIRFITMAYIEGKPLSDFVKSSQEIPERKIANLIRKLSFGLADAHAQGIVHRDLKPANVMVDQKGEPVVMDFGLACITTNSDSARITKSGQILGSPAYMSPEQIEGEVDKIGPSCDIYSLGIMFYELMTSQLPFRGSIVAVLGQIVTKQPDPVSKLRPKVDADLEAICLKMISKLPADRQLDMNEVADELTRWMKGERSAEATQIKGTFASIEKQAKEKQSKPIVDDLSRVSHDALINTINQCLDKHDYERAVQLCDEIPEALQSDELKELADKARTMQDDVSLLSLSIQNLNKSKDYDALVPKLQEFLKLKPGSKKAKRLLEKIENTTEEIALPPISQKSSKGAKRKTSGSQTNGLTKWIALGLFGFVLLFGGVTFFMKSGDQLVEISVNDPDAKVLIDGRLVSITGSEKLGTVKLDVREHALMIEKNGKVLTNAEVTVTRNDTKVTGTGKNFLFDVTDNGKNLLRIQIIPKTNIASIPPANNPEAKTPKPQMPPPEIKKEPIKKAALPEPKVEPKPVKEPPPLFVDKPEPKYKTVTIEKETITAADGPVNILNLVNPKLDILRGKWKLGDDGSWSCLGKNPHALLQIPAKIEGSYEITYDVRWILNGSYDVGFILPVGRKRAQVVRGTHNNNRSGLENIKKQKHDSGKNKTQRTHEGFSRDKNNTIKITVRIADTHARITAIADGKEFVNWFGPMNDLSLPQSNALQSRTMFGLSTLGRDMKFNKVTLEILSGQASLYRENSPEKFQIIKQEKIVPTTDRKAAEWVIKNGGMVSFHQSKNNDDRIPGKSFINKLENLPSDHGPVIAIHFLQNNQIRDEDLKNLSGLKSLRRLELLETSVTGDGLAYLSNSPLEHLALANNGSQIKDSDLAQIAKFKNLKLLRLDRQRLQQVRIEILLSLQKLQALKIYACGLGSEVIPTLKKFPSLTSLNISENRFTLEDIYELEKGNPKLFIADRTQLIEKLEQKKKSGS